MLADLESAEGQPGAALPHLTALLARSPTDNALRCERFQTAMQAGRCDVALADLDSCTVPASSPDLVEIEYRGMQLVSAEGNAGEISIEISRAPIEEEAVPMDRFTKDRFPGLFR